MIFHEIYGCYYNTVAKMLSFAVRGELTQEKMSRIAHEEAYSESFLEILPALKNEKWQLIDKNLHTPLKCEPTMPMTTLEKRWLKAISLDPRFQLFGVEFTGLDDVQPLFTPEDYVVFDKYSDGDPYESDEYIRKFRTILDAQKRGKKIKISYTSRSGGSRTAVCAPHHIEYSEKDDKFRLITTGCRYAETINIAKITSCEILEDSPVRQVDYRGSEKESLTMEAFDYRNALERVMLHFAHLEKCAEKIGDKHYRVTLRYDRDDETEMVIRVLSFGPMIKVTEPERFVTLIKERLIAQRTIGLK